MTTIPTAQEIYLNIWNKQPSLMDFHDYKRAATTAMIEFTKLHCEAQRKAIYEHTEEIIDKSIIDNAYPSSNIK